MQTNLASWARESEQGRDAEEILRRCVHCGFCLATCPTYQVLGDELDSPRGRIYLIKQVLEGEPVTASTQEHLDRCLTCRNCETTCPSGVEYGALIDIGRNIVHQQSPRPLAQRIQRFALRKALSSSWFSSVHGLARVLRPVLPRALQNKIAPARAAGRLPPASRHARRVLLMTGCVQPAMMPSIDAATIRVLDALGISVMAVEGAGCCGAINFHLDAQEQALQQMRANIDAWLPRLDSGEAEAIVVNASGCGAMISEYAHHLRHDPRYVAKALRLVDKVRDIAQIVAPQAQQLKVRLSPLPARTAFHPPCTLQHWQGLRGVTETLLGDLGFQLLPFSDTHLCCGSAGTYSIVQPDLALTLRDRKLAAMRDAGVECIVSANVGCIGHLQSGSRAPVRHWIEVVDEALKV